MVKKKAIIELQLQKGMESNRFWAMFWSTVVGVLSAQGVNLALDTSL